MSLLDEIPDRGELILLRRRDVLDEPVRVDGLEDDVENRRSNVPLVGRNDVDGFKNAVHVSSVHRVVNELLSIRSTHLLDDRGCRTSRTKVRTEG